MCHYYYYEHMLYCTLFFTAIPWELAGKIAETQNNTREMASFNLLHVLQSC